MSSTQEGRLQQIEFRAMGSRIMAAVQSDSDDASALLAEVPLWFEEWEQALSRFREDSELSKLNRSGGSGPVVVSETLWEVLQLALRARTSTGGLVTPTLLGALEAAGYRASFDTMQAGGVVAAGEVRAGQGETPQSGAERQTHPVAKEDLIEARDWQGIETYPETRSVRLAPGVRLDFGGTAKGWAADEAARRLAKWGPSLVDAGGDIAVGGPPFHGEGWPVGIDAPGAGESGEQIELLRLVSGGVATSGRDYRRWRQGEEWRHHIIDPRTGSPATSDVISATVIAGSASEAEIGAKVALLLGGVEGLNWLEARPNMAGLLALENGEFARSSRLGKYVWSNVE